MPSSAVRLLESLLQQKKLGSTVSRASEDTCVLPTGLVDLDARIGGGWPKGAISEVIGQRTSGRTRLLLTTLAAATSQGAVVALVDALDRFDPRGAREAGVDLARLLWVRGAALSAEVARPALLDHAIRQAVRAFDLIVRAGGFAVIALDLSDIPTRRVQALPAISWLRLAHANEGRDSVGLLLGEAPMGRSARGISIEVEAVPCWTGTSAQARRLAGFTPRLMPRAAGRLPSCAATPLAMGHRRSG